MSQPSPEIPGWLKKLQENSWEAEILISGGAIVGLISISNSLIQFRLDIMDLNSFNGTNELTIFLVFALKGLTIGFITHLVSRGIWIALVCLDFSFPKGINLNNLKLSTQYLNKVKNYNLINQIIRIDHISGNIYFASITFVVIISGLILTCIVFLAVSSWVPNSYFESVLSFFTIILFLFYFDMIFNGIFRKNKWVGKFYYPLYWSCNILSLAIFYRPWLQIVSSNTNKVSLYGGVIIFMTLTFFYSRETVHEVFSIDSFIDARSYKTTPNSGSKSYTVYDSNLSEGDRIYFASIPSSLITTNYLKVFIPYKERYDDGILGNHSNSFSEIVSLSLNGKEKLELYWVQSKHQVTKQIGIETYIPIETLVEGKNVLNIFVEDDYFKREEPTRYPFNISFWKNH